MSATPRIVSAAGAACVALAMAACTDAREAREPVVADPCYSCHGNALNGNAAPPPVVWSESAVDVHQQHLQEATWHAAVPCDTCHLVPETTGAAGHIDSTLPAEVVFGGLADEGTSPRYDYEDKSCGRTYCHGATLSGGTDLEPTWTSTAESACTSCHGMPPPLDHPQLAQCSMCHGTVINAQLEFIAPALHINGVAELSAEGCVDCHGSNGNPAPPKDLAGNTETSSIGVGAHRKHLGAATWRRAVLCSECHVVPATTGASGHIDGGPAELAFTGVAAAAGAESAWDRTAATCGGTYCHGATLDGGADTTPPWTQATSTTPSCDGCHPALPPPPHPPRQDCGSCHFGVIDAEGVFATPSLHINGVLDPAIVRDLDALACNFCHGDPAVDAADPMGFAPPVSATGATDTTELGVGAHRRHLAPSTRFAPIACGTCHLVPDQTSASGHIDTALPAEVVLSGRATLGGAESYSGGTCTVYCHSPVPSDDLAGDTPVWNVVSGEDLACDSCHGYPPGGTHVQRTDCASCHVGADGTYLAGSMHVDGTVQLPDPVAELACNFCHGDAAAAPTDEASWAPPVDLTGDTATTAAGVGAHQAHLASATWRRAIACSECHIVPGSVGANGHIDDDRVAELTFGALATTRGLSPAYAAGTCSNTYCHGAAFISGWAGQATAPLWTLVDGTQDRCDSCHNFPLVGGFHDGRTDCAQCHDAVVTNCTATGCDFVEAAASLHINGSID